jgi:hypothetical protein
MLTTPDKKAERRLDAIDAASGGAVSRVWDI